MNLRVPVFLVALLSIAATGDPCGGDDSSSSGGGGVDAGANGAVCEVFVDVPCCVGVDQACDDNNDCCTGNCSGSNGVGSDGGSTCAEPVENEGCTVALSSRCNSGMCACASDDDCCIGNCVAATIPGTSGKRCCLETGNPCDANADCCSLTCDPDTAQCE